MSWYVRVLWGKCFVEGVWTCKRGEFRLYFFCEAKKDSLSALIARAARAGVRGWLTTHDVPDLSQWSAD